MSAYNDEDQDNHETAEPDSTPSLGHVFRHWWNKDQEFRAFRIGFQGADFVIQDGGRDGSVCLPIDCLDDFIAGLHHVRDTMCREGSETPTFERPRKECQ